MSATKVTRLGFVMEQTLGHVTHYCNLRSTVDAESGIQSTWYPLPFAGETWVENLVPLVRGNWSVRASLRARKALTDDRADARFDALFFHTQVTALFSVSFIRKIPTLISLDATPLNYDQVGAAYGHEPGSGITEKMKRRMNVRALDAATALVTWCNWARDSLIRDYGQESSRITVIRPGVNMRLWPFPGPRREDRPVRILFVGADFDRKGGQTLLNAFSGLQGHCELHLVTKAPVTSAPGITVYHDATPNSDLLRRLYATADVFALPTLADCFPLAIQEAMASGLPVIATDVGAIGEAVRDGETGYLVSSGEVAPLRAALNTLVCSESLRRQMGARGREAAEKEYDSESNARRILQIMMGMVKKRHD